jgi:hypothetical protein
MGSGRWLSGWLSVATADGSVISDGFDDICIEVDGWLDHGRIVEECGGDEEEEE